MLRHRVIPIVLIDGFSVLKTIQFETRRNLGSPITVVRTYNTRNVDELIILDIDAAKQNRSIDIPTIKTLSEDCFMPLTVGGGINTIKDIENCLSSGADKVSINSAAMENPDFISQASRTFGSQCIVVSIDVFSAQGRIDIHSHSGRKTDFTLDDFIKRVTHAGAGELLINSVDRDGTQKGPDLELIKQVSSLTTIPIIFVGGVSSPEDCSNMIKSGASAVAASSIFHFTGLTPNACKQHMLSQGIPVRLDL